LEIQKQGLVHPWGEQDPAVFSDGKQDGVEQYGEQTGHGNGDTGGGALYGAHLDGKLS